MSAFNFFSDLLKNQKVDYQEKDCPTLGGHPSWSVLVQPEDDVIFNVPLSVKADNKPFVFSIFAWLDSGNGASVELSISNGIEGNVSEMVLNDKVSRPYVSKFFKSLSGGGIVRMTLRNTSSQPSLITIGWPQLEEGMNPTSPILPGKTRAADQLEANVKDVLVDWKAFLYELDFCPLWSSFELPLGQSRPVFEWLSSDEERTVKLEYSGDQSGRLRLLQKDDQGIQESVFDHYVSKDSVYRFSVQVINGKISVFINDVDFSSGNDVSVLDNKELDGRFLIFGSNGHIAHLAIRSISLSCKLTSIPALLNLSVKFLVQEQQWQETPLPKDQGGIRESTFRDDVKRSLAGAAISAIPEALSGSRRVDLKVTVEGAEVLVEFKVWGRNDSGSIPSKPIEYFPDGDGFGVVVMLCDLKKKDIGPEYRKLVSNRSDCTGIVERPLDGESLSERGSSFPGRTNHFVSIHGGSRGSSVEILHIVHYINREWSADFSDR